MLRPKRKAAEDAITKIQDVHYWENLCESSKVFQDCAAKIEEEFAREGSKKRMRANTQEEFSDTDGQCSEDCYESDDVDSEYESTDDHSVCSDDSFVVKDCNYESDHDYKPGDSHDDAHALSDNEDCESCSEMTSDDTSQEDIFDVSL